MNRIKLLLLLALTSTVSSAQVLFTYDFSSKTSPLTNFSPANVDTALITSATNFANVGTATLALGANLSQINTGPGTDAAGTPYTLGGLDLVGTPSYGNIAGFAATFDGTNANGLYGANAANYVGFSFVAETGFALSTLDFDLGLGGTSGPRGVTATYNLNGGGFNVIGVAAFNVGVASQYGRYSFDFGNVSVAATDTVEVRLLGFSTGTGNSIRLDNVSVTAIPEPGTLALVGIALGSLMLFRRRS
jgi:hypothetical protein